MRYHPLRWIAFSIFVLSSTLNYLDRQLSSVLAPLIIAEFQISQAQFGWLISAFSLAYAASSLGAGWMLDRLGVNRGIAVAASWWSAASVSTGMVGGLGSLVLCRSALGIGESASVPAVGKVNGLYLKPEERAVGAAVNGLGISLGLALAPLSIRIALAHSWRTPFVLCGLLSFLWIPLWLITSRFIPHVRPDAATATAGKRISSFALLKDPSLLALMLANVLWMGGYSLWSNWTTLYLTRVHYLSLNDTAALVWIPPLVSNLGGFFGGWLSLRWIRNRMGAVPARKRAIWISAAGCLTAFALPFMRTAGGATLFIAISFFFVLAGSVNLYALPIDLFGAARAGFAVSALTFAYGLLQVVISPVIGWMGDHHLYRSVVWLVTIPPLLSSLVLLKVRSEPL